MKRLLLKLESLAKISFIHVADAKAIYGQMSTAHDKSESYDSSESFDDSVSYDYSNAGD